MPKSGKTQKSSVSNISSSERLEDLLNETEKELEAIQPQIDKLEKQLDRLKELKLAKQKLITLKLSIKSILSNFSTSPENEVSSSFNTQELSKKTDTSLLNNMSEASQVTSYTAAGVTSTPLILPGAHFLPERAFSQVNLLLRKSTSINYDLFRAIVFNGGKATTEQIRQYLVENRVKQPGNGQGFEDVALTDISSRVNYLVRKGIVKPEGRGAFISLLGWADSGDNS